MNRRTGKALWPVVSARDVCACFRGRDEAGVGDIRWARGEQTYLGEFDTQVEAALAYDAAARKLHGPFAVLNFPNGAQDP